VKDIESFLWEKFMNIVFFTQSRPREIGVAFHRAGKARKGKSQSA